MLKKLLAVSSIFMLVLAIVGCGKTEEKTDAPAQKSAEEQEGKYENGIYYAEDEGYSKGLEI